MTVAERLVALLGEDAVVTDAPELVARSKDLSPGSLIAERAGVTPVDLPEAVVEPSDTDAVAELLRWADAERISIVARGGGSSVVGGISPRGGVVVDLRRMNRIVDVDERSRLVRVQAGLRGDELQRRLGEQGWMIGHQPQSIALSTVGGWIATRAAGQLSVGFGAIEDVVAAMVVVLPGGRVLRGRPLPRRSAGPRLDQLFIGSEGTLGIVTEAVVRIVPALNDRVDAAFRFEHMSDGVAACRAIVQEAPGPVLVRLYDAEDTAIFWRRADEVPSGNTLIMSGRRPQDLERAVAAARDAGGEPAPDGLVGFWWDHRNDAAHDMVRLLAGEGILGPHAVLDTFEVAATWSHLRGVYHALKEQLADEADIVGCHISHLYPDGACLYFTAAAACADDDDATRRLEGWWDRAMTSALKEGASISHHHGIGRRRAAWLAEELGDWYDLLVTVKRAVDPNGIMNPGVFGI